MEADGAGWRAAHARCWADASPTVYSSAQGGYVTTDGGYYYGGGYAGGTAGYPAGYGGYGGYYNPGGLGGPASGMGVRPGMGFGGLGRGR